MCGIFASVRTKHGIEFVKCECDKISHRGPDSSSFTVVDSQVNFGFHRLAIVDRSENGMQPFVHDGVYMICNGEIFNHKELEKTHGLCSVMRSESDCECILYMYERFGIDTVVKSLDAEFALVIYDTNRQLLHVARDPFGVRPLFIGTSDDDGYYFSSEAKAINFCSSVRQFLPGHYMTLDLSKENISMFIEKYYDFPDPFRYLCLQSGKCDCEPPCEDVESIQSCTRYTPPKLVTIEYEDILAAIRGHFIEAVKKRTMSDRTVGCLLSGGLDSSLVASVLLKFMPDVHFFSIGLKDSVDVKAAKRVISYFKVHVSHHHVVEFTVEEGLNAIEEVIRQLETYDVTTIRASVPQYLLAKYISKYTSVIVVYSGEGSDELFNGYQYSKQAPDAIELDLDTKSLLTQLAWFDNLRTDRTTAKWGLEIRVPFLDKKLVDYVLSLDPNLKMCSDQIEKKLLRDAFKGWLPDDILYRPKEAFSDAVSSKEVSWYRSLQNMINEIITDSDLANCSYKVNQPRTKEALYYRQIFNKYYPDRDDIIPRYWMPNWQDESLTDPSATVLKCHVGDL